MAGYGGMEEEAEDKVARLIKFSQSPMPLIEWNRRDKEFDGLSKITFTEAQEFYKKLFVIPDSVLTPQKAEERNLTYDSDWNLYTKLALHEASGAVKVKVKKAVHFQDFRLMLDHYQTKNKSK